MKLRGDLQLRKLGDDHILVYPGQDQLDASKVYTFNDTAVQIWLELQGKEFNIESVTAVLLNNYEVEESEAERDAEKLVKQFENQGFLI
ncbi:MAG: PqqD family protein [Sphingobacterium sp.]|jgi:hypothetical protein|nr:PqqD family protein [Sphingobacterium sp.]